MKQMKYTVNPYVTIRKAGLKKYLIKQGIISSKSFVLETDDLIDADIKLLNQIAIGESVEIDTNNGYSSKLVEFLMEESILVEEHLSDSEKYYQLINSGKDNKLLKGKSVGLLCHNKFANQQVKENLKEAFIQVKDLTLDDLNGDFNSISFVLVIADHFDSLTFHQINNILVKKKIPFMINFLDGNTTFISPIFIGQETVCYNEMEVQLEAALFYKDSYLAYKNDTEGHYQIPNFLLGQLIFYSIHFIIDYLITNRLKTKNRALLFDLESLRYDIVDILPEPYCLGCRNENKKAHDFL